MDYFAFYWTLPATWAGFTTLPTDPDAAAKASRTIRYQVQRVRRWIAEEKAVLVQERVHFDIRPDRALTAQSEILGFLAKAKARHAKLVLVDFAQSFGWRPHGPLLDLMEDDDCMCLPPDPIMMDGKWWDPVDHFRIWREAEQAHQTAKGTLIAQARLAIAQQREAGASYATIAKALNAAAIFTPNGRPWTPDNLRKFTQKI